MQGYDGLVGSPDDPGKKAAPRNPTFVGIGPLETGSAKNPEKGQAAPAPPVPRPAIVVPPVDAPAPEPDTARRERKRTIEGVAPPGRTAYAAAKPPKPAAPVVPQPAAPIVPQAPPAPSVVAASAAPSTAVLMIGDGYAMQSALSEALLRHGLELETAPIQNAVETAVAAAPDLILLVGDAARDGGRELLDRLTRSPLSSTVPVALLAERATLGEQLEAFRHGARTVIRRSASADEIAARVATLARQMPERDRQSLAQLADIDLGDLLELMAEELRKALMPEAKPRDERRVRLVLSGAPELAKLVDDFVARLKQHVLHSEQLEYELERGSEASAQLLGAAGAAEVRSAADIRGIRIVLADDDPARADAVADELRSHGATVLVSDLDPTSERFQRLRQLDPMALLIGSAQFDGAGVGLVQKLRADARARWASSVVVDWDDVWPVQGGVERTLGKLAITMDPEQNLRARVELGAPFELRLESMGAARLLRALTALPHAVRLTLDNPRLCAEVDVFESLIAGANGEAFKAGSAHKLEGHAAIAGLLLVSTGRVSIQRVERPASVNVMSPAEVALELADSEEPPIAPSGRFSIAPPAAPAPATAVPADPAAHPPAPAPAPAAPVPAAPAPAPMFQRRVALPLWALAAIALAAIAVALTIGLLLRKPDPRSKAGVASTASGETAKRGPDPKPAPAENRGADKREALRALEQDARGQDDPLSKPATSRKFLEFAREPETMTDAVRSIGALPGAASADLLYEVWTGTAARTPGTELAEQLLYTDPVRKKASPALDVALELRRAKTCEEFQSILPRATENADRRSLSLLGKLASRRGCGARRAADCYTCLRGDKALNRAISGARKRPGPRY